MTIYVGTKNDGARTQIKDAICTAYRSAHQRGSEEAHKQRWRNIKKTLQGQLVLGPEKIPHK